MLSKEYRRLLELGSDSRVELLSTIPTTAEGIKRLTYPQLVELRTRCPEEYERLMMIARGEE